jgi:hypothetical protein
MFVKNALVPEDGPLSLGFFNVAQYDAENKQYGCLPYLEVKRNQLASGGAFGAGHAFGIMTVMAVLFALFVIGAVILFTKEYNSRLWCVVLEGIYLCLCVLLSVVHLFRLCSQGMRMISCNSRHTGRMQCRCVLCCCQH